MRLRSVAVLAAMAASLPALAEAAVFDIEAGAPTLAIAAFDVADDRYRIFNDTFGVAGPLDFQNAFAADGNLSDAANVIVLQNSDNDANAATVFNARSAAGVIAANTGADRSGFFVYFNSALNINRLVFSANLNDALAALVILAANNSPTGAAAIAQLPDFTAENFQFSEVPIPGAVALFATGLLGAAAARRRKQTA
jgi:hypothetical protein